MTGPWSTYRGGPRDEAHGPAWEALASQLDALGTEGLQQAEEQIRRQVRDNGVAYTLAAEERPWRLDPVPMAMSAADWAPLEAGIRQRARLLDAYLEDVYGPQMLVAEGLVHPGLVLGHPQFLRPVHGAAVPARLQVYAADLVRSDAGTWQVTGEHAQSPAGAGFALENRIVLARAMAGLYENSQALRLAGFFLALRSGLRGLAPAHRDNPRIVLLTPGPAAETFFEHAFLARYLGLTLVEGNDLTVRGEHLYLKTLGGLHPVDVILRRLGDDWCDPLELRGDSLLGVAGLVGAVRAGNVALANALGSGVAEHLGLLSHGPALCRRLLGEELLLGAVPTVWGGLDPRAVCDPGPGEVLRPAHGLRQPPQVPTAALLGQVAMAPSRWVVQRLPAPATVPTWTSDGPRARPMTLRVFAARDAQGAWHVMPGALVRVADPGADPGHFERGSTKDLWIQAAGPVAPVSLLAPAGAPVRLLRGGVDLPSRVADNLFWLGRYTERLEQTARLLRAGLTRLAEDHRASGPALAAVGLMLTRVELLPAGADLAGSLLALATDSRHPAGLAACRRALQQAAASVRDRISNDTWRIIARLDLDGTVPTDLAGAISHLDRLLVGLCALAGMATENTTRGPAWRFLELGRRIERGQTAVELLRAVFLDSAAVAAVAEAAQDVALEVFDSAITYRTRYLTGLQAAAVLDLLLVDTTNPRSAAFQTTRLHEHLGELPSEAERALPTPAERATIRLRMALELADPAALVADPAALAALLESAASDLVGCSDAITAHYLSHATARRNP